MEEANLNINNKKFVDAIDEMFLLVLFVVRYFLLMKGLLNGNSN